MNALQRRSFTLWSGNGTNPPQPMGIDGTVRLPTDRPQPETAPAAVTIQAVSPVEGIIGVLLVRPDAPGVVLNASLVRHGIHPLRHGDRLDVGGRAYWFSADLSPVETTFDPDLHGADVRCCLTKARLRPGQAIVICPGVPGTKCGVIYRADAWAAVIQANRSMKCHNCGYRPGATHWEPPRPAAGRNRLDGLLQLTHD